MDPLLSLSITLQANKGCYGVLLGSGVSRSAGIPTGWEVILDLSRRLAGLRNEECEPDPAAWFQSTFGKAPDYADLLDELAKSPTERNQLLRAYFEPNAEEREEGLKLPTRAHKSIARLVKQGVIKVIVTTNFDRLMETALEDVGVVPQVISTPDAAVGALPLAHAACTIIKVHGDYLDTRIKNAPHELENYDDKINDLLDRLFDEYGLIICGWSADWDVALRAAIERCRGRPFSTYWVARGEPSDKAKALITLRSASIVKSPGADQFFEDLAEKVSSLDDIATPHPVSEKVAVATLKRYITNEKSRIRLADLVREETEAAYAKLMDPDFLGRGIDGDSAAYQRKFNFCHVSLTIPLSLMIHGCHWGDHKHVDLWVRVLERFAAAGGELVSFVAAPDLRMYPATMLLYGGGIAAVIAEQFQTLGALLMRAQARQLDDTRFPVSFTCMDTGGLFGAAKRLDGMERRYNALSGYLHGQLRQPFRELEPDDHAYDMAFDRFECLMALAIGDMNASPSATQGHTTEARPTVQLSIPMPVGRFGWRRNRHLNVLEILKQEQQAVGKKWGPLQAGMFGGDPTRFNALLGALESRVNELAWS